MEHAPEHTTTLQPDLQLPAETRIAIDRMAPNLHILAEQDWQTYRRHIRELSECATSIENLQNPIQTWTYTMGKEFWQAEVTLRRCQLRRQADQALNLDDEGAIDLSRMDVEEEKESQISAEWFRLTSVQIIHSIRSTLPVC